MCAFLGHAVATDHKQDYDVAIKWRDATHFDQAVLSALPTTLNRIINNGSVDISKRTLEEAFAEVFGYPLAVDPTAYTGDIVEKSDANATHDGLIIGGPISPTALRPDAVYQKLIDNSAGKDGTLLEYRVPIHGGEIPLVYLRHRPVEIRFSHLNAFVKLKKIENVLSAAESANILALAARMGIDYGEFDVLRDTDGRIYVIDANNTPWGPPNGLSPRQTRRALRRLVDSFDRLLRDRMVKSLGHKRPAALSPK